MYILAADATPAFVNRPIPPEDSTWRKVEGIIQSMTLTMTGRSAKMKVEVWSDIACPFCYIGKRRFEAGLEKFAHKEEIEVVYRSFQLRPGRREGSGA